MSKICQITGKKALVGNNVSHSKRRTKRRFNVNLFTKKFYWVEQDCWISLKISAAGLRTINKMGLCSFETSCGKRLFKRIIRRKLRRWQRKLKVIEYKLFLNVRSTKQVVCPVLRDTLPLKTEKIPQRDWN